MINRLLIWLAAFMASSAAYASGGVDADSVIARMKEQRYVYPQEKFHVVTDKGRYIAGDTIWLRAFVADAASHRPVTESRYVYVELTTPLNDLATRIKVMCRDGVYGGYIPLDQDLAEGEYMLTAYTMFGESAGADYFFRKKLPVISPYFGQSSIQGEFEVSGDKVIGTFTYTDAEGNVKRYNEMRYVTQGESYYQDHYYGQKPRSFRFSRSKDKVVMVKFDSYSKYFVLSGDDRQYDITFHPEGGYMVPGEPCRVAFKSIGSDGLAADLAGEIVDSEGRVVTTFSPLHGGMGFFTIVPLDSVRYSAQVELPDGTVRSFDLPEVSKDVAVLHADNRSEAVHVTVAGHLPDGAMLLAMNRGRLAALHEVRKGNLTVIPKTALPEGVNQLLLVDGSGRTLSERLVYVRGDLEHNNIALTADTADVTCRHKVSYAVDLPEGFDRMADMTVAVTDDELVDVENGTDIVVQLLLSSDLKGHIDNPRYYFTEVDRDKDMALDALLMTQGWTRYDVSRAISGDYAEPVSDLEKGEQFRGMIKSRWKGKPLSDATILCLAPQVGYAGMAPTGSDGSFRLDGADYPDGVTYSFQAANRKGDLESNFTIEQREYPELPTYVARNIGSGIAGEVADSTAVTSDMDRLRRSIIKGDRWDILLEEVTVKAKGGKRQDPKNVYQALARYSITSEEIDKRHITTLEDMVRRMGIFVRGDVPYYRQYPVAIYIDEIRFEPLGVSPSDYSAAFGSRMPSSGRLEKMAMSGAGPVGGASGGVYLAEITSRIPFSTIERIDFLQPNEAVVLGVGAGRGGALMITTKDGKGMKDKNWTLQSITPLGYQKPVEFYSPKYGFGGQDDELPDGMDRRSTVYWNPSVKTDADGRASFEFYTTDNPRTTYTVRVEGLTAAGEPFVSTTHLKAINN